MDVLCEPNIKKESSGNMRWLKIGLGILGMLIIGYIREQYTVNFIYRELPFLVSRGDPDLSRYPLHPEEVAASISSDPRWFGTMFFLLMMEGLTAFVLYAYFNKKYVLKISLLFYTILIALAAFCVFASLIFKDYGIGYETAQNIKNILQMPFILLVLFPVFYFIEKSKELNRLES